MPASIVRNADWLENTGLSEYLFAPFRRQGDALQA